MKVGEIFTTERIVMGGTGYRYALVRLTGEVALLNSEVIPMEADKCGGPEIHRFTFQCLRPGRAEIQLARFRSFETNSVIFEEVMPFEVIPFAEDKFIAPGGWSPFLELTAADHDVFDKAMEGFIGVKYTPERVSTQVVKGVNYRFFCYGKPATQDAHQFPAIVTIYVAPDSEAKITEIEPVVL